MTQDPHSISALPVTTQDVAAVLDWYGDIGWDEAVAAEPYNRLVERPVERVVGREAVPVVASVPAAAPEPLGTAQAKEAAVAALAGVSTIEDLRAVLSAFEGFAIRKTATHLVFADGNPKSRIMVVGEVPEAEDDRQGKVFAGESGQLLDKMMAAIGLSRAAEEPEKSVYMTYALNWRPPGDRTPTAAEIELAALFLAQHVALVRPAYLLLLGSVPARALLGTTETMTRLRGQWLDYQGIPCLISYPPSFLLKSPARKRESWEDLQALRDKVASDNG